MILKAFAIVEQRTDQFRTDGAPRIVSLVYAFYTDKAREYAMSEANELRALNPGEYNVIGVNICAHEDRIRLNGEMVHVRMINKGNLWRLDFAQFTGAIIDHTPADAYRTQSVPLTVLEPT